MPLFLAPRPVSWVLVNVRKSVVARSCDADVGAVVGGIGGVVGGGAVVVDEADEPGVLHAVALVSGPVGDSTRSEMDEPAGKVTS